MKYIPIQKEVVEKRAIQLLSSKVSVMADKQQEMILKLEGLEANCSEILPKIDKILKKLNQHPDYFTVGEIALREGVSEKTIRRKIRENKIPGKKRDGDRAYKISVEAYYNSLNNNGQSSWFQNHS